VDGRRPEYIIINSRATTGGHSCGENVVSLAAREDKVCVSDTIYGLGAAQIPSTVKANISSLEHCRRRESFDTRRREVSAMSSIDHWLDCTTS